MIITVFLTGARALRIKQQVYSVAVKYRNVYRKYNIHIVQRSIIEFSHKFRAKLLLTCRV